MNRRPLSLILAAALAVPACRAQDPAERYGFIARLGRDTVSVENVIRRGDRVTVDGVDRFSRVRRRHTEIRLGPNGSVRHLVMDIRTPSEPEPQRRRKVEVDVTADSVVITKIDSSGTLRRAFASRDSLMMAHVPQMYSLYDLYFRAAHDHLARPRGDDTVRMRQFYVDREFDRFSLHNAAVRLLAGGKAEIDHDWLAGIGEARLDSAGRLRSYSGDRTTYKVEALRTNDPADIDEIATRFAALEAESGGAKRLSVRDTVRATIGGADLRIAYGRPLVRGRVLLGNVVPYDHVWRTGANEATQFTTSAPITLAGLHLPAGDYTLWTLPHRDGAPELIVNQQTGQWGTQYDSAHDLGTARMQRDTLPAPVEVFTISIVPAGDRAGELRMEWGPFRWTAPIAVLPRGSDR